MTLVLLKSLIGRLSIECRAPKIPPLLVNNRFILVCREKAKLFNDFFPQQCKPIINSSVLPNFIFLTNKRIDNITIGNDEIIALIRNINPNKATGSDGISGQMLLICDDSVILPPKIIFRNILLTSISPETRKLACFVAVGITKGLITDVSNVKYNIQMPKYLIYLH